MTFTDPQASRLRDQTRQYEKRTGAEIGVTGVDKSDVCPEISGKAFASGAAMGAMALSVPASLRHGLPAVLTFRASMAVPLLAAVGCAALTVFLPSAARLFPVHELLNTPGRNALLVGGPTAVVQATADTIALY